MQRFWRNYNLSILLFALFALSLGLQTWMGWERFTQEQAQLGASAHWLGSGGYIWSWGLATFENWQSEFLSLLAFVVLTAYCVHRGSRASRDANDQLYTQLDRIEARLRTLETTATAPWVPPLNRDPLAQSLEDRDSGI